MRGNIYFNLDDRRQKFISPKIVLNQESSYLCVNRLLVAVAFEADEGISGEVCSEDFSPYHYMRTKVPTTNQNSLNLGNIRSPDKYLRTKVPTTNQKS